MGLKQHHFVIIMGVFCALSYIVIEILFFALWCRPFHNYWSVPPTTVQCSVYRNHLITVLSLNISSDLFMMFIPLPVLIRARLSVVKKVVLCVVFSLGIFVIICCILSKYYSIWNPYGQEWIDWYVREAGTAVIVANIPHTWPLVRRILNAREFFTTRLTSSYYTRKTTTQDGKDGVLLSFSGVKKGSGVSRSGAEETSDQDRDFEIWEHKYFDVAEETRAESSHEESSDRKQSLDFAVSNPLAPFDPERMKTTVTTEL